MGSQRPSLLLIVGAGRGRRTRARPHRRDQRTRRGGAGARNARARGRACARFRPWRGRRGRRQTVEDFRRSGLSHLLAVSGPERRPARPAGDAGACGARHSVALPPGLGARPIAIYVRCRRRPLDPARRGDGRAHRPGDARRPAVSRLYALAVAAIVTLAIDPRIAADIGWQLSFAAVVGIFLLVDPLRAAIGALPRGSGFDRSSTRWR